MFQDLYKQNINKNERQELRRQKLLQQQKLKRLEQQDNLRDFEETPSSHRNHNGRKYKKSKHSSLEDISLQFSEWMKEKPQDLNDWLLVPCPKGQRCLVVAANGETKMFSKNKRYRLTFSSYLPGGGLSGSRSDSCILDCIYNKETDTFYVLDVLTAFIPMMDCETEFRFFWLQSKFAEIEDKLEECEDVNTKSFKLLPFYDMDNEERVARALQNYPLWPENQPELDGFLFYHKHSNYVCGSTPLVCWLFPFMIPDVLEMTVSSHYYKPSNYSSPLQYMAEFDKQMARKHTKVKVEEKQMDCSNDTDSKENEKVLFSPDVDVATTTAMDDFDELHDDDEEEKLAYLQRHEDKDNSLKCIINAERLLEMEGFSKDY